MIVRRTLTTSEWVRKGSMRIETARDRSIGVRVESKRFGGCEMIRDDVGVLRRTMEMYGSGTKTIVTKGDDEIRRTIGSRAKNEVRRSSRRLAELRTKTRAWTQELNS
jgi:hypothetical protein